MKNAFRTGLGALALGAMLGVSGPVLAHSGRQDSTQTAPDNSGVNKRDQKDSAPTADQAKNSLSDRELMRRIRRDVVKDKSISTYGHNVKIIAEHGKVTLKGPVHTADEKAAIEQYAQKYAGAGNVDDQIEVKGDAK